MTMKASDVADMPDDDSASRSSLSRRDALRKLGGGLGSIALATLLQEESRGSAESPPGRFTLEAKAPHFAPRAKSVIFLFMGGGPSHVDLFDPKPKLNRFHGKTIKLGTNARKGEEAVTAVGSPFSFSKHGESGMDFSELMPHTAAMADDLTMIRSMHTPRSVHDQGIFMFHTGRTLSGYPSIGAWTTYALGAENRNLPAYMVLPDPTKLERNGVRNFASGFLPPLCQGTQVSAGENPIFNLNRPESISSENQLGTLRMMELLNRRHRESHPATPELDARIANYELAARMQVAAMDQVDLSDETAATKKMYGLSDKKTESFGKRCLLARRLVASGVRFVHLFAPFQSWDNHSRINQTLPQIARHVDAPVAALIRDLKRRGMLDETLVVWGGEFGRTPYLEGGGLASGTFGRDHHPFAFTVWMAGGGMKPGLVHGATDELGDRVTQNPVGVPDLHATILHQLGIDHDRLSVNVHGLEEKPIATNQKGRVIKEILA